MFVSYSHADTKWATWLMRRLESFRVPDRFHGRNAPIGEVGTRIAPVFRDRDELPTADDLGEAVRDALARSATLVVICSPTAARSRWVNEEVVAFKQLGRSDRVFALIVTGEPNAKLESEECFPPALRFAVGPIGALTDQPIELIAADARPHADGRDDAFLRLTAGLLGVGFDDLRQRELQRRHRRLIWITSGAVAGMAIMAGLAVYAVRERDDARRRQENSETIMARMLDDLKARLEKDDKLDALDSSGREVLRYFQSLHPRDLTDRTNLQQAKALTQIGQMRFNQMRQKEALESFTAAFERTSELTRRNPRDGEALFERAQAEFWMGSVHYKQLDYVAAEQWLTRYRDSSQTLAKLDPGKIDWQREAVLGFHNLAVLDLQRGNIGAARAGFLNELGVLEAIVAANPRDLKTRFSVANTHSFLATSAERMGEFAEALAHFDRQIATLDGLIKDEPESAHWPRRRTDALALKADVLAISGRLDAAFELLTEALRQFEQLAGRDPTNQDLRLVIASTRTRLGACLIGLGKLDRAVPLLREARAALYPAGWQGSASAQAKFPLATACRWLAVAERASGHQDAALAAADESVTLGRQILAQNRGNVNARADAASALVVAGVLAQSSDLARAARMWEESIAVLGEIVRDSYYWRLLDPLLRAHALLGKGEQVKLLAARLHQYGYRPLEKWPEGVVGVFPSEQP